MSASGPGENIYLRLDRDDRVDVTSESRVPFTTDWGKNRSNVDRIFAWLASLVHDGP